MPHSDLHKKKFKTNLAIIGGIFAFCLIVMMVTMIKMANAQEEGSNLVQCGEAVTGSIETNPDFEFCDIYQRQLDYKESADQLREDIIKRSENFAKPRQAARAQYEKDLEELHKTIE